MLRALQRTWSAQSHAANVLQWIVERQDAAFVGRFREHRRVVLCPTKRVYSLGPTQEIPPANSPTFIQFKSSLYSCSFWYQP